MSTTHELEDLRFPIGRFEPRIPEPDEVRAAIDSIESLPSALRRAVDGLDAHQMATRYRPEGWTLRQVVHHIADSHVNSWCRFRLALTEDTPTIRGYFEDRWATLADADDERIELSLSLIDALHRRWVVLLRSLGRDELAREFFHPEHDAHFRVDTNVLMYAWHGEHHVAHVTSLREREGWS